MITNVEFVCFGPSREAAVCTNEHIAVEKPSAVILPVKQMTALLQKDTLLSFRLGQTRYIYLWCKPHRFHSYRAELVKMKVVDVMASGYIKERASVLQSKTQKPVKFEITEGTRISVMRWMKDPIMAGSEYLWPGRFHARLHISTRQYARIVREWVRSIGLEATAYGTHTMRRTKVTQIYKKTGNLRAVQLLLGHTRMDSTVQYLGVELEDALEISEAIEI